MSLEETKAWLCGPMVAVATPFTEDFDLDLDAFQTNIRFMIDGGVRTGQGTLLVGGAGGEHPVLSVSERKDVMTAAVEAANGEAPVLSSIQHTDSRSILEMAQHADKAGLHGAQLGPTYYYTATEEDAYRTFDYISSNSNVPLMVYHTWWDGLHMSLDLIERLSRLDTVMSVKWSTPNATHYREVMKVMSDDLVFIDNSGQQIMSHIYGASGFITHLSGFWPQYPTKLWKTLQAHDYNSVNDQLEAFKFKWVKWRGKVASLTGGEGPFIKAAMEEVGLTVGPPRPPSVRPPKELMDELGILFKECGVPYLDGRNG
jgi:4-hydroxy-tetrahydrodipicolinate synthase